MSKVVLTAKEREIIDTWNAAPFTSEYVEHWVNRNDNVMINAPAALTAIEAKGFYRAVRAAVLKEEREESITLTSRIREQTARLPLIAACEEDRKKHDP